MPEVITPHVSISSELPVVLNINTPVRYTKPKESGKSGSIAFMGGQLWVKDPTGKFESGDYKGVSLTANLYAGEKTSIMGGIVIELRK